MAQWLTNPTRNHEGSGHENKNINGFPSTTSGVSGNLLSFLPFLGPLPQHMEVPRLGV